MKMKTSMRLVMFALVLALGQAALHGVAHAQAPTTPDPIARARSSANGTGLEGAGLGVGAAAFLGGLTGAEVVYDQVKWHLEGLLGFSSRDANGGPNSPTITDFQIGARGWYHLHQGTFSDFSVGGGIGFNHFSQSMGGPSGTQTLLEPGAEARVLLSPNFVVFGIVGLQLAFGDAATVQNGIGFGGNLVAGLGFAYFFR